MRRARKQSVARHKQQPDDAADQAEHADEQGAVAGHLTICPVGERGQYAASARM